MWCKTLYGLITSCCLTPGPDHCSCHMALWRNRCKYFSYKLFSILNFSFPQLKVCAKRLQKYYHRKFLTVKNGPEQTTLCSSDAVEWGGEDVSNSLLQFNFKTSLYHQAMVGLAVFEGLLLLVGTSAAWHDSHHGWFCEQTISAILTITCVWCTFGWQP